ncbi:hypothetical protein BU26DRAFT_510474 [Trematosphaeria pertusa]|uniref:Uncharacterized protein n=1 Tax=Trematosphaeria pertusa TaxID=390896 RepID=A0A6A6HWQ8_9PLEO|nr:uncharacterized protein BU26DRAFT_510474 [Trematosphaeria pertusa]KAF2242644.1 hypothetical protein BU26DRAFT_510474 [Trematosphaeria pertusa]
MAREYAVAEMRLQRGVARATSKVLKPREDGEAGSAHGAGCLADSARQQQGERDDGDEEDGGAAAEEEDRQAVHGVGGLGIAFQKKSGGRVYKRFSRGELRRTCFSFPRLRYHLLLLFRLPSASSSYQEPRCIPFSKTPSKYLLRICSSSPTARYILFPPTSSKPLLRISSSSPKAKVSSDSTWNMIEDGGEDLYRKYKNPAALEAQAEGRDPRPILDAPVSPPRAPTSSATPQQQQQQQQQHGLSRKLVTRPNDPVVMCNHYTNPP